MERGENGSSVKSTERLLQVKKNILLFERCRVPMCPQDVTISYTHWFAINRNTSSNHPVGCVEKHGRLLGYFAAESAHDITNVMCASQTFYASPPPFALMPLCMT